MLKVTRILILVLLFFTAINAMIAGILFMVDSTGGLLGMNTSYIEKSSFDSYFMPGLILFVMNGLMNVVAAYFVWTRQSKAYPFAMFQGFLLVCWIIIQVFMVSDFNFLHAVMLFIGTILIFGGAILFKSET